MAQRTKLTECLAFLRDGDVLTVTKPDRLARSTAELRAIEADLSKRGIGRGEGRGQIQRAPHQHRRGAD